MAKSTSLKSRLTLNSLFVISCFSAGIVAASSCAKSVDTTIDASVDPTESAVESGVVAAGGVADEQQGSSFAYLNQAPSRTFVEYLQTQMLPTAFASSCVRAAAQSCSAGVKSQTYSDCTNATGLRSFTGSVALTYSNGTCALTSNGDTMTRTYNVSISGPRGGVVSNSSDVHQNYLGSSISGGGQLTKTAGGWDLAILGKHKVLTFKNKSLFDVSVQTTSPIAVTGSLARSGRVMNGGSLVVYHNLAKFTATFTPSNLTYTAACCYPVSGSMAVAYTGSKTGSGTVTFNGCGTATLADSGGTSQNLSLTYCE